jgi:uncharacterized protein (DUF697 family)
LIAEILSVEVEDSVLDADPHRGVVFDSTDVVGALPLYLRTEPYWNLSALRALLTDYLPDSSVMEVARAERSERLMRRACRSQTERVAEAVGARFSFVEESPAVITGLQLFLVAVIAALSGEELAVDTAEEYFDEVGISALPHSPTGNKVLGVIDGAVGQVGGSGSFSERYTRGIGLSAEAYFFDDELQSPLKASEEMTDSLNDAE